MLKRITNNIFDNLEIESSKETFSVFEIYYKCDDFKLFAKKLTEKNYSVIKESLEGYGYKWDIYIESFEYSISQKGFTSIDLTKNDENSDIEVVFRITKLKDTIVVFDDEVL